MTNEEIKKIAEESLLKSAEEVSEDKEILEKLKDKVIIIKENNQIEVKYPNKSPSIQILLHLSTKFMGHKILGIFSESSSTTEEIAKSLKVSLKALSRPLGILTGEFIDKVEGGYSIRAYKILDFLKSLDEEKEISEKSKTKKFGKSSSVSQKIKEEQKFELNNEGLKKLSEFLKISEIQLRKIFFFRQDGPLLMNKKIRNGISPSEKQLNATLIYLLSYKYCYNASKLASAVLRLKLCKLNNFPLGNFTTNLHKFPEFVIHEAGPKGSQNNFFIITPNGEEFIKNKIKETLDENE